MRSGGKARARGDAQANSDYDIAIFWSEVDRIMLVVTDILYHQGALIDAMPYREGAYQERTPLGGLATPLQRRQFRPLRIAQINLSQPPTRHRPFRSIPRKTLAGRTESRLWPTSDWRR